MTSLRNKRGTWVNQYAVPSTTVFAARAREVDYVIVKYGMPQIEERARQAGVPWVAERMAEDYAGDQAGPSRALKYATQLADQVHQPGCVAAVVNLEEADGGWHRDDGEGTKRLIWEFKTRAPGKPLYASLDTRGSRPNQPYQRVCAELCDGVMPMVYPAAFEQSASVAFAAALNELMRWRWAGKEIIPTYQTYGPADVYPQVVELTRLNDIGVINGANTYTMGHASQAQWTDSLRFRPRDVPAASPVDTAAVAAALQALRKRWVDGWHAIEQRGTIEEATSFAAYWRRLTGQQ